MAAQSRQRKTQTSVTAIYNGLVELYALQIDIMQALLGLFNDLFSSENRDTLKEEDSFFSSIKLATLPDILRKLFKSEIIMDEILSAILGLPYHNLPAEDSFLAEFYRLGKTAPVPMPHGAYKEAETTGTLMSISNKAVISQIPKPRKYPLHCASY